MIFYSNEMKKKMQTSVRHVKMQQTPFRMYYCNTHTFSFSFDFSIQFEQLIVWALMLLPYFWPTKLISERGKKNRDEKTYKNN